MNHVLPQYLDGFRAAVSVRRNSAQTRTVFPAGPVCVQLQEVVQSVDLTTCTSEERTKEELHPLDAFPRLVHGVNTNQPPGADDQFRFQWFGLFYQGPRQDAFLLRLRLPGGRLTASQLSSLAEISQQFAGGYVLCNSQGGLDVPGIPVRNVIDVLRRCEEAGFRSLLTGGDCVQAVRGGEYDPPVSRSGPPAIFPMVRELEQALAMNRKLSNLPGCCEVSMLGLSQPCIVWAKPDAGNGVILIQAMAPAVGTTAPADFPGNDSFLLTVSGTAALKVRLTAAQVVPACLKLLDVWAELGDRSDRQRACLPMFCSEIGEERLCAWLAMSIGPLSRAVTETPTAANQSHANSTGVQVPGGLLLSGMLDHLAEAALQHGSGELRLAGSRMFVGNSPNSSLVDHALRDAMN